MAGCHGTRRNRNTLGDQYNAITVLASGLNSNKCFIGGIYIRQQPEQTASLTADMVGFLWPWTWLLHPLTGSSHSKS